MHSGRSRIYAELAEVMPDFIGYRGFVSLLLSEVEVSLLGMSSITHMLMKVRYNRMAPGNRDFLLSFNTEKRVLQRKQVRKMFWNC